MQDRHMTIKCKLFYAMKLKDDYCSVAENEVNVRLMKKDHQWKVLTIGSWKKTHRFVPAVLYTNSLQKC